MDIAPLTRDEIKLVLKMHGYPYQNPILVDSIIKLIRIFERDGYGISFDDEANEQSIVNCRNS